MSGLVLRGNRYPPFAFGIQHRSLTKRSMLQSSSATPQRNGYHPEQQTPRFPHATTGAIAAPAVRPRIPPPYPQPLHPQYQWRTPPSQLCVQWPPPMPMPSSVHMHASLHPLPPHMRVPYPSARGFSAPRHGPPPHLLHPVRPPPFPQPRMPFPNESAASREAQWLEEFTRTFVPHNTQALSTTAAAAPLRYVCALPLCDPC